jgi:hypothetical protein
MVFSRFAAEHFGRLEVLATNGSSDCSRHAADWPELDDRCVLTATAGTRSQKNRFGVLRLLGRLRLRT